MNEAYGAQLRRSTSLRRSTQPIHETYDVPRPMPTGDAEQSSLPWNVIIYNFPGCSAAETPYKVQQQWTTTSRLLANPGSPTEPHPRLRNGHPDVQGVQLQRPNLSFACTECFGPHNIEKRIMVKKAVKRYCSNNLKNDYESEEINSLKILNMKTRKATTNIRSAMTRRRPTHITRKHIGDQN